MKIELNVFLILTVLSLVVCDLDQSDTSWSKHFHKLIAGVKNLPMKKIAVAAAEDDNVLEALKIAKEEGYSDVFDHFMRVAQVESCHTNILHQLYVGLKNKTLYKKNTKFKWKCTNCGHEAELEEAWKKCPLCGAPQGMVLIVIDESPKGTVLPPSESYEALKRSEKAKATKDGATKGTPKTAIRK